MEPIFLLSVNYGWNKHGIFVKCRAFEGKLIENFVWSIWWT